jgi:hypothetical protein
LAYRFNFVAEMANFGPDDIAAVKGSAPLLAPLVPAVVDAVYEQLFKFDITKQHFLPKTKDYEGKVANDLKELKLDSEQVKYRKDFLGKYLVRLVTAEYDAEFIKYLDYVAKIHTNASGRKGDKLLQVDLVLVNSLFAWFHGFLVTALDSHPDLQSKEAQPTRTKTIAAFSKLLWIQNDFFLKYYVNEA